MKDVLVTGGAGSIGSEICRQVIKKGVEKLRILDNSEFNLHQMETEFVDYDNVRFLLGDVRDRERIDLAMRGCDAVIHAAAYKHVHFAEMHVPEYIASNIIGTMNVAKACIESDTVKVAVNISTDKAANPYTAMGATKLVAEKIWRWAHNVSWRSGSKRFASVRFGNVLFSKGSITEKAVALAKAGEKIPLTDPEMRRFFMSIEKAVMLVLSATDITGGGEVFVFKMPVVCIKDILEVINDEYGGGGIEIIGRRPGETLEERLLMPAETRFRETDGMFIVCDRYEERGEREYSTSSEKAITKDEIREMIHHVRV